MRESSVFPGVILENGAYSIREFRKRTGLGTRALQVARQQGLRLRKVGNRRFIRGKDFLEFLESKACDIASN